VVHLAWTDVEAYARWAEGEIPTEAEWEFAARGGLDGATFAWGEDDTQDTAPRANTWQGSFPYRNTALDGWVRTSPVGAFEPNQFGLYDMIGNVWEWTADWWTPPPAKPGDPAPTACCAPTPPTAEERSYDPSTPEVHIPRKVIKGGSHLCTTQYCFRYRPSAKQPQAVDTGTSHVGFRLIRRAGSRSE
jgi:formylglycine-generating enzyme required for sulfatase activity